MYEIGTYVDLTYLNKKREVATVRPKKSLPAATKELYDVGTQFIFKLTPQGCKAAIRIPVAFA